MPPAGSPTPHHQHVSVRPSTAVLAPLPADSLGTPEATGKPSSGTAVLGDLVTQKVEWEDCTE